MRPTNSRFFEPSAGIARLVGAAGTSTVFSTLLAFFVGNTLSRPTFHALFVSIAGSVGVLLGLTGLVTSRIDSGVVFVFFLFEPIGRLVLHQEVAPADLGIALLLGVGVARLFGHEGPIEEDDEHP